MKIVFICAISCAIIFALYFDVQNYLHYIQFPSLVTIYGQDKINESYAALFLGGLIYGTVIGIVLGILLNIALLFRRKYIR